MKRIFKYPGIDKEARRITTISLIVIALCIAVVWYFIGLGGYFVVWAFALFAAILALFVISIPRNLEIEEGALTINCVVEQTRIPFSDLRDVRLMDRSELCGYIPCFGSYGFFGYYGYYIRLRTWDTIRIYCTRRDNFIEITDIYEKRCIVNCDEPEEFIAALTQARSFYAEKDE